VHPLCSIAVMDVTGNVTRLYCTYVHYSRKKIDANKARQEGAPPAGASGSAGGCRPGTPRAAAPAARCPLGCGGAASCPPWARQRAPTLTAPYLPHPPSRGQSGVLPAPRRAARSTASQRRSRLHGMPAPRRLALAPRPARAARGPLARQPRRWRRAVSAAGGGPVTAARRCWLRPRRVARRGAPATRRAASPPAGHLRWRVVARARVVISVRLSARLSAACHRSG